MVVGPTPCGLFIEYMLILYCQLCIWLTVCGASETLQGKKEGWVVASPSHGGFLLDMLTSCCCMWLTVCGSSEIRIVGHGERLDGSGPICGGLSIKCVVMINHAL